MTAAEQEAWLSCWDASAAPRRWTLDGTDAIVQQPPRERDGAKKGRERTPQDSLEQFHVNGELPAPAL